MTSAPDAVVVGGGLAGLTAARELGRAGLSVLLLEGSPDVGGKLLHRRRRWRPGRRGRRVDAGPPARGGRPGRRARPRPRPSVLRLDPDLDAGRAAAAAAHPARRTARPRPGRRGRACSPTRASPGPATRRSCPSGDDDVSVAHLVGDRLGHEVVDRLVEPLLGGVYAGHAIAPVLGRDHPAGGLDAPDPRVTDGGRGRGPGSAASSDAPMFAGLVGGLGLLPAPLVDAGGFEVRTHATVRHLERTATGFRLTIGSAREPETLETARVVLAVPGPPAARLLADVAPDAADQLGGAGVRLDGRGHPGGAGPRGGRLLRLPGAVGGRPADQGVDVLLQQVGLARCRQRPPDPARLDRPASRGSGAPGVRRRAGRPRRDRPLHCDRPGRSRRSTRTCSAGAARSRSTPWVTSTGSPGSARPCPPYPGSPCAERRTTASASPP